MSERILSVGLDVGTTSTQMILSRLTIENRAGSFSVPELVIADREILYRSPVHFTPLLDESHVDGDALRDLVVREYQAAGITRQQVDTGAIIITGETSRKENARAVLDALSDFAGDFVVATAGPALESVLAAKGAGAVARTEKTGETLLHMDIGGGTSNLALIRDGKILGTGCFNVGGRLLKFDENGCVTYVSPVLSGFAPGSPPTQAQMAQLVNTLVEVLEMAAGLREPDGRMERFATREAPIWQPPAERVTLSFSGGVADCIANAYPPRAFGDIGPELGQAIAASRLCRGACHLGRETIRATVIGAGCHAAQLSGSTVFCKNVTFPLKNLPVVPLSAASPGEQEGPVILALEGIEAPTYAQVTALAQTIAARAKPPVYVCLARDMAKALGQALALRLPGDTPILCIDRVLPGPESYLDIGAPIGQALPVVVKTIALDQ